VLIRGAGLPEVNGRKDYGVGGLQGKIGHFVVRLTTPDNPFRPHKHEALEFWFILEGEGIATLDEGDVPVQPGDLLIFQPWQIHGLRTETQVRWICFG